MSDAPRLTEVERRALDCLRGRPSNPSAVGMAIMAGRENPEQNRKAQGYARIGGAALARLDRRGFIWRIRNGRARLYAISPAGRRALEGVTDV